MQIGFGWGNLKGRDNMIRSMHRWEDIIIMGLKFVWRLWTGMIWLLDGDQWWHLVNNVMNLGVP